MLNSTDLVKVIQNVAVNAVNNSKPVSIVFGTVKSVSPLKIFIDQKLTLGEKQLIIPQYLTDYKTKISFDNPAIKQIFTTFNMQETSESSESKMSFKQPAVKHEITVYNALKAGDKVILMRLAGGQKYLILDRAVSE
ncbi:MAG: DUF2577 domain-containing protein [Clostridia bacterium]|nr:DUF2577 domain-containing protein [Clostridia bacterium]MCI2014072.1 DUF2577 domain-containing protein [Clostridia bacterium]